MIIILLQYPKLLRISIVILMFSLGIDIIDIKSNHKLIEDNMKLKDILK
jgi:hypothetical protein